MSTERTTQGKQHRRSHIELEITEFNYARAPKMEDTLLPSELMTLGMRIRWNQDFDEEEQNRLAESEDDWLE